MVQPCKLLKDTGIESPDLNPCDVDTIGCIVIIVFLVDVIHSLQLKVVEAAIHQNSRHHTIIPSTQRTGRLT